MWIKNAYVWGTMSQAGLSNFDQKKKKKRKHHKELIGNGEAPW